MNRPLPAVRALPLEEVPAAFPLLRFAVRSAQGHQQGHDAGARHPLAGTGKLVLACTVARLAARDPDLLGQRLTLTDRHRAGARTGTLRLMGGELSLTVDDAMALVVGTGDAMCVLGVLELFRDRGADVLGEARALVAELGLAGTEITGLEADAGLNAGPDAGPGAEGPRGISWGEGVTGETTPADLCALLSTLPEPVSGWMDAAFEPAGLASGLPGVGPRTVPHQTVAGAPLLGHPDAGGLDRPRGWASVLSLPGVVVAAFLPAAAHQGHSEDSSAHAAVAALEASAALGTLGLSVWQDLRG